MKRSSVRLFVCLSHRLTATAASGKFAAERRVGRKYRLTAAGAAQSNGLAVRRAAAFRARRGATWNVPTVI